MKMRDFILGMKAGGGSGGGGDYDIYGNFNYSGKIIGGYKLNDVIIPNGVESLTDNALAGFHADHIYLPNGIKTLGQNCFQYATIFDMEIPEGVSTIPFRLCSGCTQLKQLILPSTVTSINSYFVENCTLLSNITIKAVSPPGVTSNTFKNLVGSAKIYVPAESVDAYKSASYWSSIAGRIQAIPE